MPDIKTQYSMRIRNGQISLRHSYSDNPFELKIISTVSLPSGIYLEMQDSHLEINRTNWTGTWFSGKVLSSTDESSVSYTGYKENEFIVVTLFVIRNREKTIYF